MAEEIPAAVLVGLVKAQAWTPDQGLLYASNISDAHRRVEALLELLSVVEVGDRDRLLGAALSSARGAEDVVEFAAYRRSAVHWPKLSSAVENADGWLIEQVEFL